MNETLEAIARALFRSWFVDFDPVRAKQEGRHPPGLNASDAKLFPAAFSLRQDIDESMALITYSGGIACTERLKLGQHVI
jgi:hypothetical protein